MVSTGKQVVYLEILKLEIIPRGTGHFPENVRTQAVQKVKMLHAAALINVGVDSCPL
jgi:hypothetical protein